MVQQQFAVDAFVAGVGVGEVFADIAQGGCPQQGVADGVEQDVGVGVPQQPFGMGNLNASEPQFAAFDQLVYVVS